MLGSQPPGSIPNSAPARVYSSQSPGVPEILKYCIASQGNVDTQRKQLITQFRPSIANGLSRSELVQEQSLSQVIK